MRAKGFPVLLVLVILTAVAGCDNVEWEGASMALEGPPPREPIVEEVEDEEEAALEPLELGPLVYLVERSEGDRGTLLPIAVRDGNGYEALPDPAEDPDVVERFPIGRWEPGTEFVLFDQGVWAGILTADGTVRQDASLCLPRALGEGTLALRPGADDATHFLALPRDELAAPASPLDPRPGFALDDGSGEASLEAARTLIPMLEVPWPASVPDARRRVDAFAGAGGRRAVAATFLHGDELEVGPPAQTAYSLFLVASEGDEGFAPVFSWYQREDAGGKAAPGFLAAHDVRDVGAPDLAVEVFGSEGRGLAILGSEEDDWRLVYRDPCASEPAGNAFGIHP